MSYDQVTWLPRANTYLLCQRLLELFYPLHFDLCYTVFVTPVANIVSLY